MKTHTPSAAALLAATAALAGSAARAQAVSVTDAAITFDRWNYPFNFTPGTRGAAPTFGALDFENFDERDGQMLIGIDTASLGVPAGLDPGAYRISSLSIEVTHTIGSFLYDPTYDSFTTHLDPSDPRATADADPGRPIVLTGAGLRNGFESFTFGAGDATTYGETTPFGSASVPAGSRNAFAAAFDSGGNLVDVSNNLGTNGLTPGFDFKPWAVGRTDLTPGSAVVEAVPGVSPGSTFTFDVDLSDPDILGYVQRGLADGGLFFSITSLHDASAQVGGTNPNFVTSDSFDPVAIAPRTSLELEIGPATLAGDVNGDGFVGAADLDLLLGVWNQGIAPGSAADLSGDGFIGAADLDLLLGQWNQGTSPSSGAAALPEPTAALLWLAGVWAAGAASGRRTRRGA